MENVFMIVYVFGNIDESMDSIALKVVDKLRSDFNTIKFITVAPNKDLPETSEDLVILDTVEGIEEPLLFNLDEIDKVVLPPRNTVHDYDLGFQLKYLKKLGKLGKVTIIGLPLNKEVSYLRIQSIFKKLVAQDIQGS